MKGDSSTVLFPIFCPRSGSPPALPRQKNTEQDYNKQCATLQYETFQQGSGCQVGQVASYLFRGFPAPAECQIPWDHPWGARVLSERGEGGPPPPWWSPRGVSCYCLPTPGVGGGHFPLSKKATSHFSKPRSPLSNTPRGRLFWPLGPNWLKPN